MPLYEYECDSCGHRFEVIRKFSDPPLDKCPSCGGSTVRKLMSSPAIQFKGTGWYITDYAKKDQVGAKSNGKSPGSGAKDAGGSGDKGSTSDAAPSSTSDSSGSGGSSGTSPETPKKA